MFMMRGATGRFHALHLSIRILVAALLAALLDHTHALQPSAAALQELPAPGSTAAAQLLSNPNTSGEHIESGVYPEQYNIYVVMCMISVKPGST